MKIVYILKKGLHYYPPCLAQVLYLNDLGADIVVYHGNNSEYINKMLDERGIEHYNIGCDVDSKNKVDRVFNFYRYIKTVNKLIKKLPKDVFLWFGNCESAIAVKNKNLRGRRYLLSVLELYEQGTIYDKGLKRVLGGAEAVICCEKHRAAIMKIYYPDLKSPIYVIPNKPYENSENKIPELNTLTKDVFEKLKKIKNKKIVLYQGIVTHDRPLDKIAKALRAIGNDEIVFVVMGKASADIQKEILSYYDKTVFTGYVPSPQHLCITQFANVGIANYDYSCLNNLFCAPNKIYEYAKFGIPMLTSQNIGLSETVGNIGAAECVDFSVVDEIVKGLNKIFGRFDLYSERAKVFYDGTDNVEIMSAILSQINGME